MRSLQVLIADDEPELRAGLRSQLAPRGFSISEANSGAQAWEQIQVNNYDLVLLDVRMPGLDGLEVLKRIKQSQPLTTVAIITAHANLRDAVQAIHDGAFDYIEKPIQTDKLEKLIDKALEARNLVEQAAFSDPQESSEKSPHDKAEFIGRTVSMQRIFRMIDKLAMVNTSVLIRGENGTGKELVAKAIHFNSPRKNKPFVALNCGALPEALAESEFFGHEKGAFTGAAQRKIGKFQYATGGTLFLDEIGDLALPLQVKLLRVLQEQKITPVGSNRELSVDVRIIAATNQNLEELISAGKFREDLFYRLNVMPLFLPPLRDRSGDIPSLAQHFVEKFNARHGRHFIGVDEATLNKLTRYPWPGNIRELENAIEYAFVLESQDSLHFDSFPDSIQDFILDEDEGWRVQTPAGDSNSLPLDYSVHKERFEREFIIQALKSNHGKINQTCDNAKIPKNTLLRKIRKYKISAKDYS